MALQQGCVTDRAMCNEGQKWEKGNIVSLDAFWTLEVSAPKEKQGGINHRELQAGPQSAAVLGNSDYAMIRESKMYFLLQTSESLNQPFKAERCCL